MRNATFTRDRNGRFKRARLDVPAVKHPMSTRSVVMWALVAAAVAMLLARCCVLGDFENAFIPGPQGIFPFIRR